MPVRDKLGPAVVITGDSTPSSTYASVNKVLGTYKSISALNKGAPFVPGVYRCNPVTIYEIIASDSPMGRVTHPYGGKTEFAEGSVAALLAANIGYQGPYGVLPQWDPKKALFATNKAYAKLMKSDLDVGVMLGELRETVEGLKNPLSALRKFLTKYPLPRDFYLYAKANRRGFRPGRDTADMLASSWLEWRYGIRPLLKDIQDIYEYIKEHKRAFDEKMHRRGGKTPKTEVTTRRTDWVAAGNWQFKGATIETTKEQYIARVAFNFTAPLTWQEELGIDLAALPGIAWEVTRLSFVFDWFISVGTWLNSLKVLSSKVNVYGVSVTQRVTRTVDTYISDGTCRGQSSNSSLSSFHQNLEYMKRECNPPGFNTVIPAVNPNALGLAKAVDAVTLLWQKVPHK